MDLNRSSTLSLNNTNDIIAHKISLINGNVTSNILDLFALKGSSGSGSGSTINIDAYTKQQTYSRIEIIDLFNTGYNKSAVDNLLSQKQGLIGLGSLNINLISGLQTNLDSRALASDLVLKQNILTTNSVSIDKIINLRTDLDSRATNTNLALKQNLLTTNSVSIDKIIGLQTDLNTRATVTNLALKADVLNVYSKIEIDNNFYNRTSIDNLLSLSLGIGDIGSPVGYTKLEVDGLLSLKSGIIGLNSLNINNVNLLQSTLDGKQGIITSNSINIDKINGLRADLDGRVTIANMDLQLSLKQQLIGLNSLDINKINLLQSSLDSKISSSLVYTKSQSDSNYYTKLDIDSLLLLDADVSGVYSKTATDSLLSAKADKEFSYLKDELNILLSNKQNTIIANGLSIGHINLLENILNAKALASDVATSLSLKQNTILLAGLSIAHIANLQSSLDTKQSVIGLNSLSISNINTLSTVLGLKAVASDVLTSLSLKQNTIIPNGLSIGHINLLEGILDLKALASDVATSLSLKQNTIIPNGLSIGHINLLEGILDLKALASDVATSLSLKQNTIIPNGLSIGHINLLQSALDAKQATLTGASTSIATTNLTINRALISDGLGKVGFSAVTNAQLGYLSNATSSIQTQLDAKQASISGGASSILTVNLVPSRVLLSSTLGKVTVSGITDTLLGYLDGATSSIQNQLNAKEPNVNLSINRALISNSSGNLDVSLVSDVELGYLDGVTSAIQTQINAKSDRVTTYSITEVDYGLSTKCDKTLHYTMIQIDNKLSALPVATTNSYLKTETYDRLEIMALIGTVSGGTGYSDAVIDNKLALKQNTILTSSLSISHINTLQTVLNLKASTSDINEGLALKQNLVGVGGLTINQTYLLQYTLDTKIAATLVYTKTEADNNYHSRGYVDGALATKANVSNTYTKAEVDLLVIPALTETYTQAQINTLLSAKSNTSTTYTKNESDANYYTKTDISTLVKTTSLRVGTAIGAVVSAFEIIGSSAGNTITMSTTKANCTQSSYIHYGSLGHWYIRSGSHLGTVYIQDNTNSFTYIATPSPLTGFNFGCGVSAFFTQEVRIYGSLQINTNLTVLGTTSSTSDERLKTDIQPIDQDLCVQIVKSIEPKTYIKNNNQKRECGLIAQHLLEKLDDNTQNLVTEISDDTFGHIYGIDYSRLTTVLWSTCRDLIRRIEILESK